MPNKNNDKFVLDRNVADATYGTSGGGVAVDIFKLAQTPEGRERLKTLLEKLKTGKEQKASA